ncbi:MAG: ABC transporter substrate-binding protein [Deltaproteobacteria bacterium]|nr:ABC transporter substrate-binding protein [Deltaproteobacteria bacterium]
MEKRRIPLSLKSLFSSVLLMLMFAALSFAGAPTDAVKKTTDRILAIVGDPALKGPENKEKRTQLIRQAVDERFNWEAMTQRSLARHWQKRTDAEKKEFIVLFGKLLERTYLDKVGSYSGEKVVYVDETIDGKYATVTAKIFTHSQTEVAVRYRLKELNGDWGVYDISIEGVSLVNNYRKQFNSIIVRSSYDELVKKLRAKVAEKD